MVQIVWGKFLLDLTLGTRSGLFERLALQTTIRKTGITLRKYPLAPWIADRNKIDRKRIRPAAKRVGTDSAAPNQPNHKQQSIHESPPITDGRWNRLPDTFHTPAVYQN
jgi:hypothetical protein